MEQQVADYRAWQFWLNVGQVVGYVVLGVYVWISNRHKATRDEIKDVKKAASDEINVVKKEVESMKAAQALGCGKHQARTAKLEVAVENAPTHTDIGDVYEKVNGVKGSVDEMTGLLKGVRTQVNLLVEHHMKGGEN